MCTLLELDVGVIVAVKLVTTKELEVVVTLLVVSPFTTFRELPDLGFVEVSIVPSAVSGRVITLLLAEEEGACKLKDPPPDAAFSLIFAVMVN